MKDYWVLFYQRIRMRQRAEDRNREAANLYDELGLSYHVVIEVFAR